MSRTGLPIMRPLFLEFPGAAADHQAVDPTIDNEFLLGHDLLVAHSPDPDEMDDLFISLPPGGWYDYWTGERIDGTGTHKNIDNSVGPPTGVHLHRSLDTVPVFVRAGAIVPEQPLVQSTDEKPEGPLTLRVYPPNGFNQDCNGSLYLDDGESYAFRKGDFLRISFTCRLTPQGLIVAVTPPTGTFAPWWKLFSVEVFGATRAAEGSYSALDGTAASTISTSYDPEHHRITALVPDNGKGLELKLAY